VNHRREIQNLDGHLKAKIAEMGTPILRGSPADFGRFIASETDKWARVIKFAGVYLN
jgi:tripartite-type tricarboxylate transporter receptor subunit TctC